MVPFDDDSTEEGFVPQDPDSFSLDSGNIVGPTEREFSTNIDDDGIGYLFDN